jgi:RES domain-containing protein
MRLWRISNFAELSGFGGAKAPGRWHGAKRPIIYTAESPAGALLEVLVHFDREDLPDDLQLIEIEIEDQASATSIDPGALSPSWRENLSETRSIGDAWLRDAASLYLRVPSIIAPLTWNCLLNPRHPRASAMRIVSTERFPFDGRLK